MALDYNEKFELNQPTLTVVICINDGANVEKNRERSINEMLYDVQSSLRKELESYESIQVAYVYEDAMVDVRPFEQLTLDTPFFYRDLCESNVYHRLSNVLLMGLALLEQKQGLENNQNRLYLLTEGQYDRVALNEIFHSEEDEICLHDRFANLSFHPILYKKEKREKGPGDLLEQYFARYDDLE